MLENVDKDERASERKAWADSLPKLELLDCRISLGLCYCVLSLLFLTQRENIVCLRMWTRMKGRASVSLGQTPCQNVSYLTRDFVLF